MEDAGSNPVWGSIHVLVGQLVEPRVREARSWRFESSQGHHADVMQLEDIPSSEGGSCGLESHRRHQNNASAAETDKAFEADDGWV